MEKELIHTSILPDCQELVETNHKGSRANANIVALAALLVALAPHIVDRITRWRLASCVLPGSLGGPQSAVCHRC